MHSLNAASAAGNQQPVTCTVGEGAAPTSRMRAISTSTPVAKPSRSEAGADYMYGAYGLVWHGDVLKRGRRVLGSIERDDAFPQMWRVRLPSGRLTDDMLNLTRAKDLASSVALRFFGLKVPA
jgi:hypothetical protein